MDGDPVAAALAECHGPPHEGLDRAGRLAEILPRAAAEAPERGVVVVGPDGLSSTLVTYPELLAAARRVLGGLLGSGHRPGDTVVLYGLGQEDFFPAFWACLLGGLVPLPVDARRDAGHRTRSVGRLLDACHRLGRPLVLTDAAGRASLAEHGAARALTVADVAGLTSAAGSPLAPPPPPEPGATALLMLSSGSTGTPKIIPLTHGGLVDFAEGNRRMLGWKQQERTLNWLPLDLSASLLLYHLLPVFLRMTNLHVPPELVLARPARWFDLVSQHRAHHTWAPTFGYRSLLSALAGTGEEPGWDLTHVRSLVSGGEQVVARVVGDVIEALAPYGAPRDCFVPAWGMTETCTGITFGRYGEPGSVHRLLSSSLSGRVAAAGPEVPDEECVTFVGLGRPAPGAALRVVDESGRILREGEVGQLHVRSARVTPGYLHDDAGAGAFPAGPGEWLATGDLAFIMDGQLVMVGRQKDIVVIHGEKHSCRSIEELVESVEGVVPGAVAACAMADEDLGSERLAIFFFPSPGGGSAEEVAREVGRTIMRRLGLLPGHVVPLAPEDFPRTPGGKVQRAELARRLPPRLAVPAWRTPRLAVPAGSPPAIAAADPLGLVRREVAGIGAAVDPGGADDRRPFYELGLTSVTLVRLHQGLREALGGELPVHALFEHPSIADLASYLEGRGGEAGHGGVPRRAGVNAPIALIGLGLRFPGAATPQEYWDNLRHGRDCTTAFAGDRRAGVLDHVFAFDPGFFGMSPKEAALTHPAHRLFLECAYQALESGGYAARRAGARVGVFAGEGMTLLGYQSHRPDGVAGADLADAMQAAIGRQSDFLASRVSFRLGLTGPAIGVQTACSTSLVAVHLAIQALRDGDADLALAGAAAVHLPQKFAYAHHPESVLSPTGICRPFGAGADGTVGGNGVGVVLLKPLAAALADGDPVLAVITGTAVNNDGARKAGFTAPSVRGQVDVVRTALRRAGLRGEDLSYVEAHGTGTPVGDPIEFAALSQALRSESGRHGFCAVGSVKSSIGHLDTCSGIAGLIKVVLMLGNRAVVATRNLNDPNPELDLRSSPLTLADAPRPWTSDEGEPLRAGVNSLGVGGTNAFVVLEEAPARTASAAKEPSARPYPVPPQARPAPPDVRPAFLFSGQGGAGYGMARELYASLPAFRSVVEECERSYRACAGGGLRDALTEGEGPLRGSVAQPALFAYQAALAAQWREWGVEPRYVAGHSLGEISALHAAGALSLAEGVRLTARRGRLMESAVAEGGMLAVRGDAEQIEALARRGGLDVAARNGPREFVLSGALAAVKRGEDLLGEAELDWRRLDVDRAFHSAILRPILGDWERILAEYALAPLAVPLVSSLDGAVMPAGAKLDPLHLVRHARQAVRFDLAVPSLRERGCGVLLEIGPRAELTTLGRRLSPDLTWVASRRRGVEPLRGLALAAGELDSAGCSLARERIAPGGRRASLPGHPFQRTHIPYRSEQERTDVDDEILGTIKSLTADRLGLAPDLVDVDSTFAMLGGDSLSLASLTRRLERMRGVRVPLRVLFEEADTPRKLAHLVAGADGARPSPPPAAPAVAPAEEPAPAGLDGIHSAQPLAGLDGIHSAQPPADLDGIYSAQLKLAEGMIDKVTGLMARQLDLLASRPRTPSAAETPARTAEETGLAPLAAPSPPVTGAAGACDFSLYFFGDYPDQDADAKYAHILAAAEFADANGFHALWMPERHFHSFGGLFPNPSVLAAALATRTSTVRLHAGSVVLPLHDPIRVAEEWSVVDNLSQGRAGLCVAPGWHADDFALAPGNFGGHRDLMYERLDVVRRLWAGERTAATSGTGEAIEVALFPRPIQSRPPLYTAVAGNPASYRRAAENDLGIVTNLMSQSVGRLAENIALYRRVRSEHGLDPAAGRVVVLVHTYMGDDLHQVRQEAAGPFRSYLRSSLHLLGDLAGSLGIKGELAQADEDDLTFVLDEAYRRYCDDRALIGTAASCRPIVRTLVEAGADEIACFVDFGVPGDRMLSALPWIAGLREGAGTAARRREVRPRPLVPPPAPASPAQRRLWIVERMYPGRNDYWEPKGIYLEGRLDVEALQAAVDKVVARHPQLSSVFREAEGGVEQVFLPPEPARCPIADMTGRTVREACAELTAEARSRVPDLSRGPLLLATLARLGDDRHLLFLLAHHIVFDSMSTAVFTKDVAAYYRAWPAEPADLPSLSEPVGNRDPEPGDMAFWLEELAGAQVLHLPADHAGAGPGEARGRGLSWEFGGSLAERVDAYARARGATPFMVIVSALGAVLGRMSGQDDFVIGTAVTDRPEGTEHRVGMYINTLVLRMEMTGDPDFPRLLRRVRERSTRAYEHQSVPFDDLVTALNPDRVAGANPLLSVMVEYENAADVGFDPPRVRAELVDIPADRAPFAMTCYLSRHDAGLRCAVEYDSALFDESAVVRILDYTRQVLARATDGEAAPLSTLTRLTPADQDTLREARAATVAAPPACLHQLVEEQARRTPDAVAIAGDEGELTYRDVDHAANALAHALVARGVGRGSRVAVRMAPSARLVITLLAVLKTAAAYVPLDISLPQNRIGFCLDDSQAALLVVDEDFAEAHPGFGRERQLYVAGPGMAPVAEAPPFDGTPEDIAYCVYTSGSTGRPKAVQVPHRGPVNLVRWQLRERPSLRTLQWTSPGFDVSVQEVFATLASGAALVVVPEGVRGDPEALGAAMNRHGVQRLHLPFTPLKYLAGCGLRVPSLREICVAGEPLTITKAIKEFLDAHGQARLLNQYGPTETSVIVTSHQVTDLDAPRIPIGRPIDNVTVRVLDERRQEVPVGAVGELYVGGVAVARGYLNDPGRTAECFLPADEGTVYRTGDLVRWRADGTLEFHGRTDEQVKIRGHRVEPGETRHALGRLPEVRDSAVVMRPDATGEPQLAAYVVLEPGGSPEGLVWSTVLRERLRGELPSYLVPDRWVRVDEIPMNANGKLEPGSLPDAMDEDRAAREEHPVTPLEKALHEVWCGELGLSSIPVNASFFDLGGNSLKALRVITLMRERFGSQYPLIRFMAEPDIRSVARHLAEAGTADVLG
jgi:natural product biosynthesis luciferase-like monooxygenase protein/amino acid adenylation domain-containing protein